MRAGALLALAFLGGPAGAQVRHVDASLDLAGELLDHAFVDLAGDGRLALCTALRMPGGRRELRLHRIGATRVEPEPFVTVPVLEDVVAYGFADVRAEPGRELLLFTRTGVWSYSTAREGYRGNVERLIEAELLFDVPDPRALPRWSYVVPRRGGDLVIVPVEDGIEVHGPRAQEGERDAAPAAYERMNAIATGERRGPRTTVRGGGRIEIEIEERRGSPPLFFADSFPGAARRVAGPLLRDERGVRAPALVDVDHDGRLDLLVWRRPRLELYLQGERGFPSEPTRVELLPEYLAKDGHELTLRLVDLDGDGDLDLLAVLRKETDGFENARYDVMALLQREGRFFPDEPDQVLRFEAGFLRVQVLDANGDGRPDLAVRQLVLPDLVGTVTGVEFELVHMLFFGEGGAGRLFERRPALRQAERFSESSVAELAANRELRLDCDGDGIPDLVEIDLAGRIAIRRLTRSSGFLRGRGWTLDAAPWKRFDARGSIASLEVLDLNGDGLCDVVSRSDAALTILLSSDARRVGGR